MGMKAWLSGIVPIAAMVMMECLDVGLVTLSKAAMSRGMNHFVFVVYYNALASLIFFLLSFIFHRTKRPPLTFSHFCKFFLLGLPGITVMQNWVFTGVSYSSPTLCYAMSNLIPAFTFLLAVAIRFGFEKLKKPDKTPRHPDIDLRSIDYNWVIGGLFFAAACLSLSAWNTCQSTAVSLIAVRDSNAWKLRPDIELISIIYSAIIGVVAFFVQNWCIRRKGPVFASMFKPLGMGIAAIIGVIFLGETLHIGSVIGAIIIATGCYVVAWLQYREEEESKVCEVVMLPSTFEKAPMLDEPEGSMSQFDGFHCGYKEYNPVYSVT
ncbi:WAT1-related protein At5g07050-like [Vitis vinifera]|uniref:WAT1-related protein At5g07050-like n=1 Tax=Vitis vinifera TaxID=29760 RepID=UPI0028831600|nr:WAT1-related protein At5g07050-like [Vitis vinifera]